jgi:hypothetical protein
MLQMALDEVLSPTIKALSTATPDFLKAALRVLREGWCALVGRDIEIEKLQALRHLPAEIEAANVVQHLLGADHGVPEIEWDQQDLLAPPRLRS